MSNVELSKEDLELLEIVDDPILWCETFLKNPVDPSESLRLRPFQKEIIGYNGLRRVTRIGRRAGKSVAIGAYALYKAFTAPNTRVLIVTPYEAQIKVIFDDVIRPMVVDSPVINGSVLKDRSQPFEITFTNRSAIVGMTAGTRSGQHGSSIRGQGADVLILDEADYLSRESITAITAIVRAHKGIELWASSTPTGRREWFYEICTDPRHGFRQFHYPSSVNPDWDGETEKDARLSCLPEEFEHEYLAEFGSQAMGVFNPDFVDLSTRAYSYDDIIMAKHPENKRIMGVDWNAAKHGVQITIVEFCKSPVEYTFIVDGKRTKVPLQNKFVTIQHVEIKEKELTQHKAKLMILKLLVDYQVDHLYVDEGYGATSVEDLYLASSKYPGARIKEKLHAVNLASKITIRDPVTKLPVDKPIKPYMVGHAKLRVEEGACIFPADEDYPTGIVGQMRAYSIVRYSDRGYPTYSTTNDHALDAWMMAMLGFAEEYSELKRVEYASNIIKVSPERMKMFDDAVDRLGTREEQIYRQRKRPSKVTDALKKEGVLPNTVYAGWDPALSDDSDEAIARRKMIHEQQQFSRGRSPWRSRKRATASPVRENITVSRVRTPWSR